MLIQNWIFNLIKVIDPDYLFKYWVYAIFCLLELALYRINLLELDKARSHYLLDLSCSLIEPVQVKNRQDGNAFKHLEQR